MDAVFISILYLFLKGTASRYRFSAEPWKREFQEEIHADITVGELLGVTENIFTYQGKTGHEIVFLYSIEIPEDTYKDEYEIDDEADEYEEDEDYDDDGEEDS